MREARLKVEVVWTSIWAGLILVIRLVHGFFLVQKAVLMKHFGFKLSVVRTHQSKKHEVSWKNLSKVMLLMSLPSRSFCGCQEEWSLEHVYLGAFIVLPMDPVSALPVSSVVSSFNASSSLCQLKNELQKNLQDLSSFLLLKSPTPCFPFLPLRHVLGFLGVLSPF